MLRGLEGNEEVFAGALTGPRCRGYGGGRGVIEVTRLNGTVFFLNPDLLEIMEATPDTVILLTNGHRYVVRESPGEVVRRVILFRRMARSLPECGGNAPDVL